MQDYLARVAEALHCVDIGELENAVQILKTARENSNIVWVVGNGGSAATAEHFANDLLKAAGVRAVALPSLSAAVLAYGNDEGWELMFSEALQGLRRQGDVLVAISCGGSSPNVLEAAQLFHHDHLIVLTGHRYDSPLAGFEADARIFAKAPDIRVQEDVHLAVCHAIVQQLQED